jgi:RNA polymerase primary sigma factor
VNKHNESLNDDQLKSLLEIAHTQGFLTYGQINEYIPDEDVNPEKLDQLLMMIEEQGIDVIAERQIARNVEEIKNKKDKGKVKKPVKVDDRQRRVEDPVRMYLTQMGEIPLLTREQEISLAKKIEITRKRFRRHLLESDYAMKATIDILIKVSKGELPFDRTIKVSLTESVEKDQVLGRMPLNLKTLEYLQSKNQADFEVYMSAESTPAQKKTATDAIEMRRRKMVTLVEELSLRTQNVQDLRNRPRAN